MKDLKLQNKYFSATEVAEIFGISRMHVNRLIRAGKIPAIRIGRNFAIKKSDLGVYSEQVSDKDKKLVEKSVHRVFKEYGDVIKKLGEE